MTYRTEFPDFPEADMPKIPAGFADTSWHNDACPTFTDEELELRLAIDYADPAKRECYPDHTGHRFVLEKLHGGLIIETNEWSEILTAIKISLTQYSQRIGRG